MIWALVKRDPAWKMAWLVSGVVAIVFTLTTAGHPAGYYQLLAILACFGSRLNERATLFEAGLPIAARDLICARLISLLAVVWLQFAVMAALSVIERKQTEPYFHLTEVALVLTVLVLAAQSWGVRQLSSSRWTLIIPVSLMWAFASLANLFFLSAWVLTAAAIAIVALLLGIWMRIPLAFEVMPAKSAPATSRFGFRVPSRFAWMPVIRAIFPLTTLGFVPIVVMSNWTWGTLFCIFPIASALSRTGWVQSLPIRRWALLTVMLLPSLLLPLAGILIGFNTETVPIQWDWTKDNRATEVRPPLEFWRLGPAPLVTAPWGETWQPLTEQFRGAEIYNPYSNGSGSSTQFFEWQFQRATNAVYGHPIPYFVYKHARLPDRPVTRQTRFLILSGAVCAGWELFMVNILFLGMNWRVQRLLGHGSAAWILVFVVQFGFLVYCDLIGPTLGFHQIAASVVNAGILHLSAALPGNSAAAAMLALLPAALLCWTASRLFAGIEPATLPATILGSTK